MLCSNYNPKLLASATTWFASEKYDGWRLIRKNGKFIGRSGKTIAVPDYIKDAVAHIPANVNLDGELWLGYDKFQDISTALDAKNPGFQWLLFDMTTAYGGYENRLDALKELIGEGNDVVRVVQQTVLKSESDVDAFYAQMLKENPKAEGIVLRPSTMEYKWNMRDDMFMKRKPVQDIEARVIGYHTTHAKKDMEGYVSSLVCTYVGDDKKTFNVAVKTTTPPPVGSIITVTFQNMTLGGLPRFPRFKAIRSLSDMPNYEPRPMVSRPSQKLTVDNVPSGAMAYTMEHIIAMQGTLDVKAGEKVYIIPSRGVSGYHCVTKAWNPATKPYCTCAAWKFQRMPAAKRTCKHTLAIFPELANA